MQRNEVFNCLLCNTPINNMVTWKNLLTNHFSKSICEQCEKKFERYENQDPQNYSLYQYNQHMKDFLHRYKFMYDVLLSIVFREQISRHLSKRKEIIVPIPIHPQKKIERTFAHVDELLIQAKIPFVHYLDKLTTQTQLGKSRVDRINTPQLFQLKDGQSAKEKEFILVDDIYTTGTTIQHAKRILLEDGAKKVSSFTLIRG